MFSMLFISKASQNMHLPFGDLLSRREPDEFTKPTFTIHAPCCICLEVIYKTLKSEILFHAVLVFCLTIIQNLFAQVFTNVLSNLPKDG